MDIEFIQKNWYLFAALVVILALIVLDPIRRRSSGAASVNVFQLQKLLGDESAVVLDVSEPAEFKKGHISGAINIPISRLKEDIGRIEKHKRKPLVVVCRAGNRSGKAINVLKRHEFEKLYTLEGGFAAWEKENFPVVR